MSIPCDAPGCKRYLKNKTGKTQHMRRMHPGLMLADTSEPSDAAGDPEGDSAEPDSPSLDAVPNSGDEGDAGILPSSFQGQQQVSLSVVAFASGQSLTLVLDR